MARFTAINDKPITDCTAHEIADFFTEHIFFKFMDTGRSGMSQGVRDLVATAQGRVLDSKKTKKEKEAVETRFAQKDVYGNLYNDHLSQIMSAFIAGGTPQMRNAIFQAIIDQRLFD